jgi:outer membrane protein TolC|tara:strand:+ start:31385 stop:32725 length:1341 start_codon:yes stop_codon:yes gene_type:complete
MKNSLLTLLLIIFSSHSAFATADINLEEVVDIVSERNYQVLEAAEKVFQARAEISTARGNVLPKLNFWTIIKQIINPTSLIEAILPGEAGIAPFLVPANGFRLKESQILFDAEREAYRGVWANEVMNTKSLYLNLLLDQQLLDLVRAHAAEVKNVYNVAQTHAALGSAPLEVVQELEIRWSNLSDDVKALERLIQLEYKSLSYALGISFDEDITIGNILVPDIKNLDPINYSDFEFRAVDSSPEKRQLEHFLRVIPYLKKEAKYSFFGNSSASRGVAGGVFDDVSIQDDFGFGRGATRRILEGEEHILELQKTGVVEVLKRQLQSVVSGYNLTLEQYANIERRTQIAESRVTQLINRLQMGQNIDLVDLTDAYHRSAFEKMDLESLKYNFVINEDKFHRLIFHGDYRRARESLLKIDQERKKYLAELAERESRERRDSRDNRRRRP